MFGAIIVTAIVNPLFLIPVAVLGVIFIYVRKIYLKTGKNIKRLEGISKFIEYALHMNVPKIFRDIFSVKIFCYKNDGPWFLTYMNPHPPVICKQTQSVNIVRHLAIVILVKILSLTIYLQI